MTSRTVAVWTATAATVAFVLSRHQACRRSGRECAATAAGRDRRSRAHDRRRRDRRG